MPVRDSSPYNRRVVAVAEDKASHFRLTLQCGHEVVRRERDDWGGCLAICDVCRAAGQTPARPATSGPVTMTMPQSRRLCVSVGGVEVYLTRREHQIVEHLLLMRPNPVDRESLTRAVYGGSIAEPLTSGKCISVCMTHIRQKGVPVTRGPRYTIPIEDHRHE